MGGCTQKRRLVSVSMYFLLLLQFETRSLTEVLCLLPYIERLARKPRGTLLSPCPSNGNADMCHPTLPGIMMQVLRIWTYVPMPVQWACHLLNHLSALCGLLSWKATISTLTRKSQGFSSCWKRFWHAPNLRLDLVHEVWLYIWTFRSTVQPLDF
jgi:hypothetical protein